MRRVSVLGGLLAGACMVATLAAPSGALGATDPAPPSTPTPAFTLTSQAPSAWTVARDGSKLAISSEADGRGKPTITVVDLRSGGSTTYPIARAQYALPDPSLSADGRYLSWTTATSRPGKKLASDRGKRKKPTRVFDPTTWIRDLTTGAVRSFKHYDGNLYEGDGSFIYAAKGPIARWGDPGNAPELASARGILYLATGRFVRLPGGAQFPREAHQVTDVTPDGRKAAYVYGDRCRVITLATRAVKTLGKCGDFTGLSLSDDGSTVFSEDLGGWIDAQTGQLVGPGLDRRPYGPQGRAEVYGPATGDLSQVIVVCVPGMNPASSDLFEKPRRTYLLDRATRAFAPLAGPTDPLAAGPGSLQTGLISPTTLGDELFWSTSSQVFRASTTPTGPAGPLPADCQPA